MLLLLMIIHLLGCSSADNGTPVLSLTEAGDEVKVTCTSDGWKSKPTITWKDSNRNVLTNSTDEYKEDKGLMSVRSWLLVFPSNFPSDWISCSVGSGTNLKEGRVLPLKPASLVAIKPDASTTPFLEVGKNQTRVTCKSITNEAEFVHVLCKERIYSGRFYWEITALTEPPPAPKIGKSYECPTSWYIGVTNESAEKNKKVPLTPENGYRVLQYDKQKGYYVHDFSLTQVLVRDRFSKLGVFLDCVKNKLSFFDCDKKSHLYTFYNVNSTEPLIPVLSPGDKLQHTMMVCDEQCINCDELYA